MTVFGCCIVGGLGTENEGRKIKRLRRLTSLGCVATRDLTFTIVDHGFYSMDLRVTEQTCLGIKYTEVGSGCLDPELCPYFGGHLVKWNLSSPTELSSIFPSRFKR